MVDTRDRILTATIELFRRQGYNGTSVKQVVTAAGVPFSSLYHFFPGGKEELAEAALATAGRAYQELFEAIYDAAAGPAEAITDFFDGAAAVLDESGYADPCPIGTVASEVANTSERLRQAGSAVFDSWAAAAAARLERDGVAPRWAGEIATVLVAAIQGAFLLGRVTRDPTAVRATGRLMRQLVETALTPDSMSEVRR